MTRGEKQFYHYKTAMGYTVLRGGWPDFLVIAPDGTVSAAEVKSMNDRVSPRQVRMHAALERSGIPVTVVSEASVLSLNPVWAEERRVVEEAAIRAEEETARRRVALLAQEVAHEEEDRAERVAQADRVLSQVFSRLGKGSVA